MEKQRRSPKTTVFFSQSRNVIAQSLNPRRTAPLFNYSTSPPSVLVNLYLHHVGTMKPPPHSAHYLPKHPIQYRSTYLEAPSPPQSRTLQRGNHNKPSFSFVSQQRTLHKRYTNGQVILRRMIFIEAL